MNFLCPSWRSLNLEKGHVFTIPKRSPAELPGPFFASKNFNLPQILSLLQNLQTNMGFFTTTCPRSFMVLAQTSRILGSTCLLLPCVNNKKRSRAGKQTPQSGMHIHEYSRFATPILILHEIIWPQNLWTPIEYVGK